MSCSIAIDVWGMRQQGRPPKRSVCASSRGQMNFPRCLILDTSRMRNWPITSTYPTEAGTCVACSPITGSWEKRSTSDPSPLGGNASAAEESSAARTTKCVRISPGRRSGSGSTAGRSTLSLSGNPCPGSTNWPTRCACAAPEKTTGRHQPGAPHGTRFSRNQALLLDANSGVSDNLGPLGNPVLHIAYEFLR